MGSLLGQTAHQLQGRTVPQEERAEILLAPGAELRKQLDRDKLRLDGIRLVDDVDKLAPVETKPARKRRSP